ncbi:MAG: hypothetical protein K9H84_03700 [Bacteroidales bacterium]|nr:hypothetical protein [Bacteroidales bacterium]
MADYIKSQKKSPAKKPGCNDYGGDLFSTPPLAGPSALMILSASGGSEWEEVLQMKQ